MKNALFSRISLSSGSTNHHHHDHSSSDSVEEVDRLGNAKEREGEKYDDARFNRPLHGVLADLDGVQRGERLSSRLLEILRS